jgi:hypothetical protein
VEKSATRQHDLFDRSRLGRRLQIKGIIWVLQEPPRFENELAE